MIIKESKDLAAIPLLIAWGDWAKMPPQREG
jgi:hypothetical protein